MSPIKKEEKDLLANKLSENSVEGEVLESSEKLQEITESEPGLNESPYILRKEIEAMNLDDEASHQVQSHAQNTASFEDDKKVEYLLDLAKKDIVLAIKTAQEMNNPFVLDSLHDALVEGGHYEKFKK